MENQDREQSGQSTAAAEAPTQSATREERQPTEQRQPTGELLHERELSSYRGDWDRIQAAFVDEPRRAVEQADKLVSEVIQQITRTFASERQNLEQQWSRGDSASTEDLRVALQRYRQFFQGLLKS